MTGICSTGRSLSGDRSTCNHRNYGHIHGHCPYCMHHVVHQGQNSRAAVPADDHSNVILQTLLGLMLEAMCELHMFRVVGLD